MRNASLLVLPLTLLLAAPSALAEDQPSQASSAWAEAPPAPSSSGTEANPARDESAPEDRPDATQPATSLVPAPATLRAPAASAPSASSANSESFLRPALTRVAHQTRLRRYGESALGLTGAGVLFGTGFVAEGQDMTWSHALWVTSGIVALGSIANVFVPSALENLERTSEKLSDAELERAWQKLAHQALVSRRVEAVFGGLFGIASISLGVLAFEGELGTLTDEERRILGTVLVGGGALGITGSAVQWFVPTPIETGLALATTRPRPKLALSGAPSPSGFHLSLTGSF